MPHRLGLVDADRARGIDITIDQYPRAAWDPSLKGQYLADILAGCGREATSANAADLVAEIHSVRIGQNP